MRIFVFLIYFFSFLAYSHEYQKNDILIDHPIIKVNTKESKVGAGYMKIINNSQTDVYIERVTSNISEKLEIHEVVNDNNVYKMRNVEKPLLIPAGGNLAFKAKSYHVMFYNIFNTLDSDNFVSANLHFNNNLIIPIKFKVVLTNINHTHH